MNWLKKWWVRYALTNKDYLVFNKIEYKSGITKVVFHSSPTLVRTSDRIITTDKRSFKYADYGTKWVILKRKTLRQHNWSDNPKIAKLEPYKANY